MSSSSHALVRRRGPATKATKQIATIISMMVLFLAVLAPAATADQGQDGANAHGVNDNANAAAAEGSGNASGGGEDAGDNADDDAAEENAHGANDNASDNARRSNANANASDGSGNADEGADDANDDANANEKADDDAAEANAHGGNDNADDNASDGSNNADEGADNANDDANDNANDNANDDDNASGGEGNRGFVQLSSDGETFFPPNNEPHLPCEFWVGFYNFREGTEGATVSFSAQPPSGGPAEALQGYAPTWVDFDTQNDRGVTLNASQYYDLTSSLSGLERHDQQGYHIKLTVTSTPQDVSADQKHHVFWVDCGPEGPPPGGEEELANLTLDKVVTGDDAPTTDPLFSFTVTCDGTTVPVQLRATDDPWSWNDDSGEDALDPDAECSVDETVANGADRIRVTFNGAASAENRAEELDEGDNAFVVTNIFGAGGVGGDVVEGPAIEIVKVADPTAVVVGDTITYTYRITNTGDVTLTELELDDDQLGDLTGAIGTTTLEPGEQVTVTIEHVATEADVGVLVNVATVTALGPADQRVTDTAVAEVEVAQVGGLVFEQPVIGAAPGVPPEGGPQAQPVGPPAPPTAPAGQVDVGAEQAAAAGQLPRTGAPSGALLLLALALLGIGGSVARSARTVTPSD